MAVTDVLLTTLVTIALALMVGGRLEWAGLAVGLAGVLDRLMSESSRPPASARSAFRGRATGEKVDENALFADSSSLVDSAKVVNTQSARSGVEDFGSGEVGGVDEETARGALRRVAVKMPIRCRMIQRKALR